jgi:twinkle protein
MGEKDANAILTVFGADAVRECVENAKEPGIDYVIELADVQRKDDENELKIRTGIMEFDEALKGGIRCGQLFMLTGKSGQGKSTFASQILAEALNQGVRVFAYSGELDNEDFQECLNSQLAGDDHMTGKKNEFGNYDYTIDSDAEVRIKNWYRGRMFIYDNNRIVTEKDKVKLTELIRHVIVRKGVQLVLVDNLMTAMEYVKNQNDLHLAQTNFVAEMKSIAQQYHIAIIMIAHPRKQGTGEARDKDLENDDIAGSSNITNLADIVASYSRAKAEADHDSILQITKNRKTGKLRKGKDSILLLYSAKSKRIKEVRSLTKRYGWENEPIPVQDIDVPF